MSTPLTKKDSRKQDAAPQQIARQSGLLLANWLVDSGRLRHTDTELDHKFINSFLSVIERATRSEPRGQQQEEWTTKLDHNQPDFGWIVCGAQKISHRMSLFDINGIIAAHNAALAAERVLAKVKEQ